MRSLAIMQPYFFPYLGYWQLIKAVDKFVLYDDVNYIKGGWINRNRILINSEPKYITAPLRKLSSGKPIAKTELEQQSNWREKLLKMIAMAYGRALHFPTVYPVIENLVTHKAENLSDYLSYQIRSLSRLMEINTELATSSSIYKNSDLSGQDRVLDICKIERATTYINAPGGRALYDSTVFRQQGIDLRFMSTQSTLYSQMPATYLPNLSIIDLLMRVGFPGVQTYLDGYQVLA